MKFKPKLIIFAVLPLVLIITASVVVWESTNQTSHEYDVVEYEIYKMWRDAEFELGKGGNITVDVILKKFGNPYGKIGSDDTNAVYSFFVDPNQMNGNDRVYAAFENGILTKIGYGRVAVNGF